VPDYERDESFQQAYAASAASPEAWQAWRTEWIDIDEDDYQRKVGAR
jgi:glutaconate CoA-transferase subunit A